MAPTEKQNSAKGNDDTLVKILGLELKSWQYNNEYGDIIIACQHNKSSSNGVTPKSYKLGYLNHRFTKTTYK